jgi:hypothetical protein
MTSTDITANATTVADIYAAFGRGDVPAILDTLADGVAWGSSAGQLRPARPGVAPAAASRPGAGRGVLYRDRRLDGARLRRPGHHRRRPPGRCGGARRVRDAPWLSLRRPGAETY